MISGTKREELRCTWLQELRGMLCPCVGVFLLAVCVVSAKADDRADHFENKIRPIIVAKCLSCHSEAKSEGGLRLDSLEHFLQGGDSGHVVERGEPEQSLLIEAIKYEGYEMPPSEQLSDATVRDFERWVRDGLFWPEAKMLRAEKAISDQDRQWWSFLPLSSPEPPQLEQDDWSQTSIDRFVFAALDAQGMRPAPRADPETLLRRLYFSTIGLPPSGEDLKQFLKDPSQTAFREIVDRLLDDPRYGEHWARFWLDLVRYSESDGWNQDAYRPEIWRYRDYVVNSLNHDKPYPQFVREQLAGDEMSEGNPEHLIATGFLRLGIYEYNQRDARGHWNDIMNEMTDVAGDVFLGVSMACARCHDHKFDPILQTDYFQLRAFFEPVQWRDDQVAATSEEREQYELELQPWLAATQEVRDKIDKLVEPYHAKKWVSTVDKFPVDIQACFHMPEAERTSWQHQMAYLVSRQFEEEGGGPLKSLSKEDKKTHEALKKELAAFDHLKPKPLPRVMSASDFSGLVSPTIVQDDASRTAVPPGFLQVLEGDRNEAQPNPLPTSTGRRTALAEWIGDPANGLTYRVIVNRIWQHHFGVGLVATPSDFGTQGAMPTHADLLEWLASGFASQGGHFKDLHREILLSATWQQSAVHPKAVDYQRLDSRETLLWRAPVRRLRAEQIRDAMLAASGELEPKTGGASVDEKSHRRSLYVKSFRNKNDRFLDGFDVANGLKSVAVRDATTTPTQALLLINGTYAHARAKAMAANIIASTSDPDLGVEMAIQAAWGRAPSLAEKQQAYQFLGVTLGGEEEATLDEDRLAELCHVLFNSNQFLYID